MCQTDAYNFTVIVTLITKRGALNFLLRHKNQYPFSPIFFFLPLLRLRYR